jgi:thioredoxin 1
VAAESIRPTASGIAFRKGVSEGGAFAFVHPAPAPTPISEAFMANDKIIQGTEANFEKDVLGADTPVLVDFWAPWCGPCKAIAPLLDKAADDYAGRLKIAKVNTDSAQSLAIRYGVQSIPTLLVFKGGEVVNRHVGTLNRAALDTLVGKAL